jgi:hypothetical protein
MQSTDRNDREGFYEKFEDKGGRLSPFRAKMLDTRMERAGEKAQPGKVVGPAFAFGRASISKGQEPQRIEDGCVGEQGGRVERKFLVPEKGE